MSTYTDPSAALFLDWCSATGRTACPAEPGTVTAFVDALPATASTVERRLRAIAVLHRSRGFIAPAPHPALTVSRAPRAGLGDDLGETLSRIPAYGWPEGMAGRRDAVILTLVGHLGLTRRQVIDLRLADIGAGLTVRVDGEIFGPLEMGTGASTCPRCVLTRWLWVVAAYGRRGRDPFRRKLAARSVAPAVDADGHDCVREWVSPADLADTHLVRAIDAHGWMGDAPLSRRSVSAVVATRTSPQADVPVPLRELAHGNSDLSPARLGYAAAVGRQKADRTRMDAVMALLDDTDTALDEALAASERVLTSALADRDHLRQLTVRDCPGA